MYIRGSHLIGLLRLLPRLGPLIKAYGLESRLGVAPLPPFRTRQLSTKLSLLLDVRKFLSSRVSHIGCLKSRSYGRIHNNLNHVRTFIQAISLMLLTGCIGIYGGNSTLFGTAYITSRSINIGIRLLVLELDSNHRQWLPLR